MLAMWVVFILCILAPVYTYALYPLILSILPSKKYLESNDVYPSVSVILSAYNEEKHLTERLKNLSEVEYPSECIEFLIGSDGSSDRTNELAETFCKQYSNFEFVPLKRGGKVNVLNTLIKKAKGEILVFTDATRFFEKDAIANITRKFIDKRIGCVNGIVYLESADGAGHGGKSESAYWKYETWVKKQEGRIGRLSGANGPIYAIRSGIINEIKGGIINDDFYTATYILQSGYDVVMDDEAVAYGEPNSSFISQFKRHVRDGAGHYQALAVFWRMLLPRKGSFVFWSHRVIKWLVPFNLIIALIICATLASSSRLMLILISLQIIFYLILVFYYFFVVKKNKKPHGVIGKIISLAFYFMSINLALFLGWIRYMGGKQKATWETQR